MKSRILLYSVILLLAASSGANGEETGKTVLRDYIHATVGFSELGENTNHSPKSLMRMLGPSGNPQARNLFEIVHYLQLKEKVRFRVRAAAAK